MVTTEFFCRRNIMKTKLTAMLLAAGLLAALSGAASARDNVSFSLSIGVPGYAYVDPPPVYYYPEPRIYYPPTRVYYAPGPVVIRDRDWDRHHRHWDRHHNQWRH